MRPLTVGREGSVEVEVPAAPDAVWSVLSDVTRIGEWSHECRDGAWLDEPPARTGARFRGRNRNGPARWGRVCVVTEWDPPRRFAYRTEGSWVGDSTAWTFTLQAAGSGTRIVQSFRVLSLPRWAEIVIMLLVPGHHDRLEALAGDLSRLGEVASGEQVTDR